MDDLTLTQQLITGPQETAGSFVSVQAGENADLFLFLFSVVVIMLKSGMLRNG